MQQAEFGDRRPRERPKRARGSADHPSQPPVVALSDAARGSRPSGGLPVDLLADSAIAALRDDQPHAEGVLPGSSGAKRMRDGYLRGALSRAATPRQMDVLAAFVAAGGSVPDAAKLVGIRPGTVKRHCETTCERDRASPLSS